MLMLADSNSRPKALANLDTESAVIGTMMIEPKTIDRAADRLKPDDFYDPLHGRLFEAIVREHALGGRPTPVTLRPLFEDDPSIKDFGGVSYLARLTGTSAGIIGFNQFVDSIVDLAARRRLLSALEDAHQSASDVSRPILETVDEADAALVASIEQRQTSRTVSLGNSIAMAIARVETIKEGDGKVGATTGIAELDQVLGGFEPGQLVIIAGRPGMGKTAVACSAALGLARQGHGVLFASLEMRAEELGMRMVSDLCCRGPGKWIPFDRIVNATTTAGEDKLMASAGAAVAEWPLEIEDTSAPTLARLTLALRRAKRRMAAKGQTLNVVILDYLQLVHPDSKRLSAYEAVSEVSRGLKALAKEMDVAIIALAQLSRAVEQREDKRPQLSDLRDSGQIEQDADSVLFLYREEYYLERSKPKRGQEDDHEQAKSNAAGWLSLICAKRRQGRVGESKCLYLANYQAVRSADWGRA